MPEPRHPARTALSRADLLRYLAVVGDCPALAVAWRNEDWFGFFPENAAETRVLPPLPDVAHPLQAATTEAAPAADTLPERPQVRLYGVIEHREEETAPPPPAESHPAWDPALAEPRNRNAIPPHQPLVPWPRFGPALRRALQRPRDAGLDWPRLLESIVRRSIPRRPPRRQLAGWAANLVVLLDYGPAMRPYTPDLETLCRWATRWRGSAGLQLRILSQGPRGPWLDGLARDANGAPRLIAAHPIPPGTQVLLVSELGLLADHATASWHTLVRDLRRNACDVGVLSPLAARHLVARHPALVGLPVLCWNPAPPMRIHRLRSAPEGASDHTAPDLLLALLSPLRRIDRPLLRAVRLLHPLTAADAGLETLVWNHPDLERYGGACWFRPETLANHLERFARLSAEEVSDEQLGRFLDLRKRHHGCFNRALEHEEILRLATHLRPALREGLADEIDDAHHFLAALAQATGPDGDALRWYAGELTRNADPATREHHSAVLGPVYRLACGGDPEFLPEGLAHADVFTREPQAARSSWLVQQGNRLLWQGEPARPGQSPLAGPIHSHTLDARQNDGPRRVWRLTDTPQTIALLDAGPLVIHSGSAEWRIDELEIPWWALEAGRDREGAYILMPGFSGQPKRFGLPFPVLDWPIQIVGTSGATGPETGWTQHVDEIGPYVDLRVGEVTQRLRWIPPGEFLMGSPEDEPEINSDEHPRHRVILTEGYWLADTACTQALWQAVMGSNPSDFIGDTENPVDSVSWDDVQGFLQRLGKLADVEVQLPSEAEWEYACRAGTVTPFWWGERLTVEDANYDGNHPYNSGEKGEWRKRTVPVKSFRPNPWGLLQMHGNVWEWCRDGLRDYTEAVAVNPEGSAEGGRALRGGSWISHGRYLRAAYRHDRPPGYRTHDFGFRFLLRSPGSGARRA